MRDDEQSPKTYKTVKYIRISYADSETEDRNSITNQRNMIDRFILTKPLSKSDERDNK